MKTPFDILDTADMKERIGQLLSELAAPLFTQIERATVVSQFLDISGDCFRSRDVAHWKSELCFDGTPLLFALTIDDLASLGLRYYIDPYCGPGILEKESQSISDLASKFAPSTAASNLVTRLSNQHLVDSPGTTKTYFVHGFRFSPGPHRAYRIYFNTKWRQRREVWDILGQFLQPDDVALLASPSMATLPLYGVGYDIREDYLEKIKVYLIVDTASRDRVNAIARDVLGNRASDLETLMTMAFKQKNADWRMPRTVVTVGFWPQSVNREVKVSFASLMWEWDTFSILRPLIKEILDKWHFPERTVSVTQSLTETQPSWRFFPFGLSLGVSRTNEILSIYFQPARPREIEKPLRSCGSSVHMDSELPGPSTETLADRSRAFRTMFDTLLNAEA